MANNNDYVIKSWRSVVIMQEVERGFEADFIDKLVKDWSCVDKYAYIVHDKDDTRPHIHCAIRFYNPVHTDVLLNRCNKIKDGVISFECLNKCRSWKGTLAYFIHAKNADKYQYSIDDIDSNYDYKKDIEKALEKSPDEVLADIYEKINSGECRPFNLHHFCSPDFYDKYRRTIENYFKYHQLVLNEKIGGNRNMTLMYFWGEAKTGKTTFAKDYCKRMGYSFYVSDGGTNPLDNYGGQDCIILDDLRASDYKFNEFLKLTDNHTASMAHCRYYNKSLYYCKLMIVTSTKSFDSLYNNLLDNDNEQKRQLLRRFSDIYHFTNNGTIEVYYFDDDYNEHKYLDTLPNPISGQFRRQKEDSAKKRLSSVFGAFGVYVPMTYEQVGMDGFTVTNEPTPWHNKP